MNGICKDLLGLVVIMVVVGATMVGALAAKPGKALVDVWWADNTTNHYELPYSKVDRLVSYEPPQPILKAKITIPYDTTGNVITPPALFVRESALFAFNRTIVQCDDTEDFCFYDPVVDKKTQSLTFWVEHFTDYLIGAGQDYDNITACLDDNNATDNVCVINEEGVHVIQGADKYHMNDTGVRIGLGNVTLDCNGTILEGDGLSSNYGVQAERVGNNITIQNCHTKTYRWGVFMDAYEFQDNWLINHTDEDSISGFIGSWGDINGENITLANEYTGGMSLTGTNGSFNNVRVLNYDGTGGSTGISLNSIDGGTLSNVFINSSEDEHECFYTVAYGFDLVENMSIDCPNNPNAAHIQATQGTYNNLTVNSGAGPSILLYDSSNVRLVNSTINHATGGYIIHQFFASYSPITYGGTDYTDIVRYVSSDLGSFTDVSNPETQVAFLDGDKNIDLMLCGGGLHVTVYVEDQVVPCAAICGSVGLACDYFETDVFTLNGYANYTWNGAANVTAGSTDPPYARYNGILFQDNASIYLDQSYDINITGNVITQTGSPQYASIMITDDVTNILMWDNHFRSAGIIDLNGTSSACFGATGNFYLNGLTPSLDDCGQSNITSPLEGIDYVNAANTLDIEWALQDGRLPITYGLYYSLDNLTWTFINTTSDLNYSWDYEFIPNTQSQTNLSLMVLPNDGVVDGTNVTRSLTIWKEVNNLEGVAALLLLPMLLSAVLLIGAVSLNDQHSPLKIAFYLLSIIPFFVSMHMSMLVLVQYYGFTAMQDLIGTTVWWSGLVFGVIVAYFIIYFIYVAFRTAAQNKKARLEY